MSEDYPANLTGFRAGSVLAGYRLETQVGAGGMAVVFRARDERLNRPVALKILAPGLASDSEFRRRFIFESRAAAAVDDPHIIPVYEAGESDGVLFIAMRFVQGGDLRMVLDREGTLAPARAAGFISPVASALDAAHAAGLIHRDVKPGNILVDARAGRPDHVYLSDFGVSKGAIPTGTLTGTGIFIGTPDYSAPEQIQGLAVDGRSDQYALACVAYHLLTGGVPFDRPSAMAVMMAHVTAPRPSLVSRRPDLPEGADEVLAKAMAKLPEDRYDTCGEFGDALRESFGLTPYDVRGAAAALLYPTVPPSRPPVSNPPVESVPPPVESVPPPVESVPLPVESVPPPVESVPPPAKSVPPPAKSIPPPAAAAGPATMDMPGSPIPDSPAEPDVGRTVTIVAVPGSRSDSRPGAPAEAVVTSPEVDHGADSDSDDGADSAALPEAAEPAEDVAEAPGTRVDLAGTRVDTPSVAAELPQTMVDAPAAPAAPLGSADTQDMTPAELDQLLAPAPEPPAPAPAPKPPAPAAPSKRRPRNPLSDLPTAPAEIFPLAAAAGTVAAPSQPSAEPVPAVEPELSPVAESETAVAEPESAVAEPEAAVEPEVAESEAAVAEPETAVEPESTPVAEPEAAVAESETAAKPEAAAKPERRRANRRWPSRKRPVAEPEAAVEPELTPVAEPETAVAEPETASVAEPEAAAEPELTPVAEPETAVAEPETAVESELTPVAEPEAAAEPELTPVAEPETAAEPEPTPVAEPETAVTEPDSAVAEPEAAVESELTAVAEPETAAAEPEAATEPEPTPVAEPETAMTEPDSAVAEPELSPVAEPETAVEPELSPVAEPEAAVELEPGPVTEPKLAAAEPEAAVLEPEPAVAEIADPVSGGGLADVAESPAEAEVDVPDHAPPVAGEQIWALVPPAETVPGRGAGRDGVSPVTLPRESVGQRPGTKTALARHRRLSVLAAAGVIVGAAAVIPFVMMSSPNSSNTGKSGHPSSSPSQSGSLHPSSSPTFGSPVSIEVPAEYSGGSQGLISSLAFSPSGGTLAIADSGGICLLDVATRLCTSGFASAWSVAFSPDGILAGGNVNGSSAANQTIHLWNVTTRTQNLLTNPSSQGAYSVAFSHDGKTLAAGDANGSIYLWNAATRTQKSAPLTDPGSKGVNTVVFSLDDKTLAAGDGNGHVYVWDLITHKQIGSLSLAGGKGVTSIALSPDGKTLAAGDASGSIYLWDVPTKTESLPLHNPDSHGAYSVAFSHDSKTLAAGGGNGDTYVWNVTSRNQIATLPDRGSGGINSVVFSPDGKTLAIGDEHGGVTLWQER